MKKQLDHSKLLILSCIVLLLVLFSCLSASGAITLVDGGIKTSEGTNITEHSNTTLLNFTASEDSDITSLNLTFPEGITFDASDSANYTLPGFENVSDSNVSFNGNVLNISNGTNIIVHSGTQFSINLLGSGLTFNWGSLTNQTYTFYLNTSATATNQPIYLTIDGEPSVIPVNFTQSSDTWVKNGSILSLNTSITDAASGVKNATVNITEVNESAGIINLNNIISSYWANSSFLISATDGVYNLPITSYDNASHVNNSVNFTVWVDNTKPTVTPITFNNTPSWVSNGTSLPLNVSVSDSGAGVYNVSVGAGMINNSYMQVPLSNDSGYWINDTIIVGTSSQGQIYLPIFAYDNLNNVNETVNFTVWVDNTEPEVTAISPTDVWMKNGSTLDLNVSAVDIGGLNASNVRRVTVNVSDVNATSTAILNKVGETDYWTNNSLTITSSSEGSIDLQIGADDNAGNVNNSVNVTVNIDNTAPILETQEPVYPMIYGQQQTAAKKSDIVYLNVTAYEDTYSGLNVSSVEINLSGLNDTLGWEPFIHVSGNNFTYPVVVNNSSTGTVNLPVRASDNASNMNQSTIQVELDNTAPVFSSVNPVIANGTEYPTGMYYYYDSNSGNPSDITIDVNLTETGLTVWGNFSEVDGNTTSAYASDSGSLYTLSHTVDDSTNGNVSAGYVRNVIIYAVDGAGNVNVTDASAGPDPFIALVNVTPEMFDPTLGGSTTDWSTEISDFTNASNLVFENEAAGIINFTEPVNLCDMNTVSALQDLSSNMQIAAANMSLDSAADALVALNVSADLTMYNLSEFTSDPGILMDGVPIVQSGDTNGDTVTGLDWNDTTNNLTFSVSHWTSYSADGAPPVVIPNTPPDEEWLNNGSMLDLNASIYDIGEAGMKNATVNLSEVNASSVAILENTAGNYWINNSMVVDTSKEGIFNLTITAYDNVSNVNDTMNLTVKIDNTAPAISNAVAVYPSEYDAVKDGGTVVLKLTATDGSHSGVNTSSVKVNVSGLNNSLTWIFLNPDGENFTNSVIVSNDSTGTVNLPVSVADNAGNINTSQSISVVLDSSEPLVTGISPLGSDWMKDGTTISLNVSSTDVGSAGMSTVTVDTSDISATETTTLTNTAGDYWTSETITISASSEGIIELPVTASDNLSNVNSSVNLSVKVDNTIPSVTNAVAVYQAGTNAVSDGGTVVLNLTAADGYSGVNVSTVEVDASGINSSLGWETLDPADGDDYTLSVIVNNSSSGTVYLPVRAADNVSNLNDTESIAVVIDNIGPTVNPVSPTGTQWFKDGDTLELNATIVDSGVGVKNATVDVSDITDSTFAILENTDGNYWFNDSLTISALTDGVFNLSVTTYDNASNVDSTVNLTIKIDNTEPLISDAQTEYPTGYTAVNNGSVLTLNATVSDAWSGVSSVTSIDNVSSISTSDSVTLSRVSSTNYWINDNVEIAGAEGTYLLNVTATDQAGNVNNSAPVTFEVIIDNTDPVFNNLTLSTENPGSYGESIEVTVNVSDSSTGVKSVTAAGVALADQGNDIWNGTISAEYGANTVNVVATDNAGNSVSNTSLSYTGPTEPSSDSNSGSSSDGMSSSTREEFLESRNTYEGANIVAQETAGTVPNEAVKIVSVELSQTEVTGVEVESDVDIEKISVSVQKLDSKPDSIQQSAPGKVHSYLNIEVSDLDSENIAGASITFRVEKTWLEENGIGTDNVVLSHYTGNDWEQLETSVSGEEGDYVYYVAKTPGFSTFAIGSRTISETANLEAEDGTDQELSGETDVTDAEDNSENEDGQSIPGFEILYSVLGISVVTALLRPGKRKE